MQKAPAIKPRLSVNGAPARGQLIQYHRPHRMSTVFIPMTTPAPPRAQVHELVPHQRLHSRAILALWLRTAASVSGVSRRDGLMIWAVVQKPRMASGGLADGWQTKNRMRPTHTVFNLSTPHAVPSLEALDRDSSPPFPLRSHERFRLLSQLLPSSERWLGDLPQQEPSPARPILPGTERE